MVFFLVPQSDCNFFFYLDNEHVLHLTFYDMTSFCQFKCVICHQNIKTERGIGGETGEDDTLIPLVSHIKMSVLNYINKAQWLF